MNVDKSAGNGMLRTQGFTLLEVLIALSILAFGLLAVAAMQDMAIHGNAFGNEVTRATTLAQAKLEELKSSTDIANEPDSNDQDGIFNRSWQLAAATGNSRRVTITVTWAMRGSSHNVVLSTITRGNGE